MELLSIPRVTRRVFITSLALFFLLLLIFLTTGQDTFVTDLFPFLSTLPPVFSNGTLAFLLPITVVSSPTAPPVSRPHPAPVSLPHWGNSPNGRWIVSYVTGYDDEALHNIRHRRPLNGTAKLVTRGIATYFDFDDFASSPVLEGSDAEVGIPVYSNPTSVSLMGFPDLKLASPVDDFQPRAMLPATGDFLVRLLNTDRRRGRFHHLLAPLLQNDMVNSTLAIQHPYPVAPTIGPLPLGGIPQFANLPLAIVEARESEQSTLVDVLKQYGFLGYLGMMVVALVLPILVPGRAITLLKIRAFCSRTKRAIDRLAGLYNATLIHIRACIFKRRYGFEWIVAFFTQLFGPASLPQSRSIHDRLLAIEDLLALQQTQGLSLDPSLSPSTDSSSPATSLTPPSALNSEFNRNFDRIMEALEERLNRDEKPAADPPFLSPAWAERSRAGTLSSQINSTSTPVIQTRPQPKYRRVPFGDYDPESILKLRRLVAERRTTLPPMESESGTFDVSPSSPTELSTTLQPDLTPTVAPTTSPATPPDVIVKTSSHGAEKNHHDSTPAPEPSQSYKSAADVAAQVSGTASHARLLETSRSDGSGAPPGTLRKVRKTTAGEKNSGVSKPNGPPQSETDLDAQVSGTVSHARCFGVSRPELSSDTHDDGSSTYTTTASRALWHNAADADPSARVIGTVSKAISSARTGLDVESALASSRPTSVVPQHLNAVEDVQAQSKRALKGGTTQRQASTIASTTLQAIRQTSLLTSLGQKVDFPNSTAFGVTVAPPSDGPMLVASRPILRKTAEAKGIARNKVVTFSEDVQVRELPTSEEERDARRSLMPSHKNKVARKSESEEKKQANGEDEMDWQPTPMPAPVGAQGPGNDAAAQGFSIVQQPVSVEEWQGMAGNLVFGGAGSSQVRSWPLLGLGWANSGAFQALPSTRMATEPQDPLPMDVDVEVDVDLEMLSYALPPTALQASNTPAKRAWLAQVRRELCGITWQRQYTRRRIACFGF